jgi:hypothetical protein
MGRIEVGGEAKMHKSPNLNYLSSQEIGGSDGARTRHKTNARLPEVEALSQGLSQESGPPNDLCEVVTAWQSLAEPLKAAILVIVRAGIALTSKNFFGTPPPVSGETINPAETKGN